MELLDGLTTEHGMVLAIAGVISLVTVAGVICFRRPGPGPKYGSDLRRNMAKMREDAPFGKRR